MNELIEEIYSSGKVEDGQGNQINPFPTALSYELGVELYNLIYNHTIEKTLEIGMAYGLSSLFICQAHHDKGIGGHHTAIDPMESIDYASIGLLNISRAGLDDTFKFYESCSYDVLPQLYQANELFDLIFIDGMHLFDYALVDFFYSDLLLKPGGLLIIDDVWMPSIRKMVMFVIKNRHYELVPDFFLGKSSLLNRVTKLTSAAIKDPLYRMRLRLFAKCALQNPFDISAISSAIYLGFKGNMNYWCLRKLSEDDRKWHHYRAF